VSATTEIVPVVVLILGLGVLAQVLSDRLEVPSVLFLILAGVGVGPEGLGLISPDVFGDALPAIVGLSVAVIVFEGAFHLRLDRLREAPSETLRLVTVGAVVSLLGTAAVVHVALGAAWDLSLLVGSLLIATGPTVITPIMDVVAVRERVASTLETEGVVNDVTAAILAVVTFEYVVLEDVPPVRVVQEFVTRMGLGVVVGTAVALVAWYVLRHTELSAENAPRNARLVVLIAALGAYGLSEPVLSEAGIAAAAASGLVLGNTDIPYREDIEQFKGDITLVVLAFVFITLASLLSLDVLVALGLGGIVVVAAVVLVIRPLLVGLCTRGDQFSDRERLFIGAIGPRGIIPASVATLFALDLRSRATELRSQAATARDRAAETTGGEAADAAANAASLAQQADLLATQADILVGTVFLVILVTVVLQGGFARHIAQALDVIPMRVLIIGGGRVGRALARRLENRDEEVVIIENDPAQLERVRELGFAARRGDGTDREVLRKAGAENARVIAATTSDDDVNLLVAQLARNAFDAETVIARVNEPANEDAFDDLDVEAIPAATSIASAMDNVIERPALNEWMTAIDRTGDVQEIEVTADSVAGKTVSELAEDLPDDVHLALVSRDGESRIPHADDRLETGDHITFIGRTGAVDEAITYCHPKRGD
jgi:NhaP-type Na+/H+ or K+/H+ antiporter